MICDVLLMMHMYLKALSCMLAINHVFVYFQTQALIYKYVPIIGPIFGSAFIIGLYMLSRLVKGDLTDRMNMMSQVCVCVCVRVVCVYAHVCFCHGWSRET